jgi:MFS superfamily sulfate permease-like transporter
VILDASAQDQIDVTSTNVLKSLLKELRGKGIAVYAAEVHAPVREFSRRAGLLVFIGEDQVFPTLDAAVRFVETAT